MPREDKLFRHFTRESGTLGKSLASLHTAVTRGGSGETYENEAV